MSHEEFVSDRVERYRVEDKQGWREWGNRAPWLQFPPDLEVKIIPPFGGAMARFMVRFAGVSDESKHVSVYWDVDDSLGAMGKPYWEIYPVKYKAPVVGDEDVFDTARFLKGEESEMMVSIIKSLMGEYE